jgi:hypothetical protein
MKKRSLKTGCVGLLVFGLCACYSCQQTITIEDIGGVLGETSAPVLLQISLNEDQTIAAGDGRVALLSLSEKNDPDKVIPLQLDDSRESGNINLVMIMPDRGAGSGKCKLIERQYPTEAVMKARVDPISGQVLVEEGGEMVLHYNYQTIHEKDVIRLASEALEEHVREEKDTFVTTSIYAVPRSDYIHPLYGLEGEMLTRDWPAGGHPHHRAIFWAWPEVEYGNKRGDIYALQRIFARPTGNVDCVSGPVFAQVIAENLWMWEDTIAIVREHVVIRVYRATDDCRIIDLTIKLEALQDSITIATRNTDSYGGLNLRMMTPEFQDISYHTDEADADPRRAWSDFNGIFAGNTSASGLMVLQHSDNPDYPGKWVEYPNLAWVQPTFPAPGTRYPLSTENSLILKYRLIIHSGGRPDDAISEKRWDAYHDASTPSCNFQTSAK